MAETVEVGCDGVRKWLWYNVQRDLQKRGGLGDVVIDPLSVGPHSCGGRHGTNPFFLTWIHEQFLLVTMEKFSQLLVDAFARVVEYRPFCRYVTSEGLTTVEWDKENPTGRFATLQHMYGITQLVQLPVSAGERTFHCKACCGDFDAPPLSDVYICPVCGEALFPD